jgi:hypothetical protein
MCLHVARWVFVVLHINSSSDLDAISSVIGGSLRSPLVACQVGRVWSFWMHAFISMVLWPSWAETGASPCTIRVCADSSYI